MLIDALAKVRGVRSDPAPEALIEEFGDSSVNFAVRFWHDPHIAAEWRVRDELARVIKTTLDGRGVEIPFPQVVLHFKDGIPDAIPPPGGSS